jgi:hypothetical protein
MKNINIMTTTMMIWALALIFNLNTATAAENRTVFEMGESGQTVSFPVTATEISAADAEDKKPVTLRKANSGNTGATLLIYEVGEGGHRISFPLTLAETTAKNTPEQRSVSKAAAKSGKSDCQVVAFEMAESGLLIEFPAAVEETVVVDEDTIASQTGS